MRATALLTALQPVLRTGRHTLLLAALALFAAGPARAEEHPLAPDFALRSVDGPNIRLSELRGDVVLLSFWAQWCGECRQALPVLSDLHSKYQRAGLVLLSINVDDDVERAASAAKNLKLAFPVLFDQLKQASAAYRVQSMPLLVLIDRDGRIQYTHAGYQSGDERQWSEQVRLLLNK